MLSQIKSYFLDNKFLFIYKITKIMNTLFGNKKNDSINLQKRLESNYLRIHRWNKCSIDIRNDSTYRNSITPTFPLHQSPETIRSILKFLEKRCLNKITNKFGQMIAYSSSSWSILSEYVGFGSLPQIIEGVIRIIILWKNYITYIFEIGVEIFTDFSTK